MITDWITVNNAKPQEEDEVLICIVLDGENGIGTVDKGFLREGVFYQCSTIEPIEAPYWVSHWATITLPTIKA